jgi:hypothetical protein
MPTSVELRTRARLLWLEADRAAADDFAAWADRNWAARTALALADEVERQRGVIGVAETPLSFFLAGPDRPDRSCPPETTNDR